MDDPTVTIGGHAFLVPEFPFWAQRKVSPSLMRCASYAADLEDEKKFGDLIDTIYLCLTINTKSGKPDGEKINAISKDDFECLKIKALPLALEVLPVLLRQAGLAKEREPGAPANPGEGSAAPETPLPGETTSTS